MINVVRCLCKRTLPGWKMKDEEEGCAPTKIACKSPFSLGPIKGLNSSFPDFDRNLSRTFGRIGRNLRFDSWPDISMTSILEVLPIYEG